MNEKERQEQLRTILSLTILPLLKENRRKLDILHLLNLVGIGVVIILISVSITLILIQGV